MVIASLANRLRITPTGPGVYLLKDSREKVLYVGKAANLRSRLRSYFATSAAHEPKIRRMLTRFADFDYIVTDSSGEALILENTLIKKHRPQFNARLKDDKTYPYIKIDRREDFPQIYITRRVENDGSTYFGPFATAGSIRKTLALLKKLVPLPLLHQGHNRKRCEALPGILHQPLRCAVHGPNRQIELPQNN